MSKLLDKRVLIVGLGLIGGSIARGLRDRKLCAAIYACGRDEIPLRQAKADGAIDEWSTDLKALAGEADVIILAVPALTVRRILDELKDVVAPDTIITDAASVKGSVVEDFRAVFPESCHRFVPAHPIAGSEENGYKAANGSLYVDRKVILTPLAETDVDAVQLIRELWAGLGAQVHEMGVEDHDSVLAATSHLPHLLAYALVNTLIHQRQTDDIFRYAAGGFAGFTRIASSDPVMWRDIFLANGKATVAVLDAYTEELARMRTALVEQDGPLLMSSFEAARETRNRFIKEHFSAGQVTDKKTGVGSDAAVVAAALVLTIDGPSGSGKGTISARIAATLGWHYLDSGALYRLLGLAAELAGVSTTDEPALVKLIPAMQISFGPEEGQIWLNGDEVSRELRGEKGGALASEVAIHPAVRIALLDRQQAFRKAPGVVADGRDMGTVVFPDAAIKVFLTASAEERAKRRYKQLIDKGIDVNLFDLFRDIKARDERDTNRSVSPLKPAIDAVIVDTTEIGIEQVVARVLEVVHQRFQ